MTTHGPQIPTQIDDMTGAVKFGYAPGRDFINIYPYLLLNLSRKFDAHYWRNDVTDLAADLNVSYEEAHNQVSDAIGLFADFVNKSCKDPDQTILDVLEEVGWNNLHVRVRRTFFNMLGCLAAGQLFAGLRDVSLAGENPPKHWKLCLDKFWEQAASIGGKPTLLQRLRNAISNL